MRLAVLDPGSLTGVAVFTLTRMSSQMVSSRLEDHYITDSLDRIRNTLREADEVVAEEGPQRRRQPEACEPVETLIKHEVAERGQAVHWVRPTDWKPHPQGHLEAGDFPEGVHDADAISLGRYFIGVRSRELVSI